MSTITQLRKEKIESAKATISGLNREIRELEAQETKTANIKGIEKWLGYEFESSSGLTEEYAQFARDFKKELKAIITKDFELVSFNRGHFYLSGFLKNKSNGNYIYFSISDVRWNGHDSWYNNLLVRTAKHDKDFTGGSNDWSSLPKLNERALYLSR